MEALVNEPVAVYGQSTRSSEIKRSPSLRHDSSIYFSKASGFSDVVSEMIQKLSRLNELLPNWDSYHADAPSPVAIHNALFFLIKNHSLALPFYFLAPGVNGEVMIEFKNGTRAAELYFLADGSNEIILFENDEVVLESNLSEDFRRLIQFFNP